MRGGGEAHGDGGLSWGLVSSECHHLGVLHDGSNLDHFLAGFSLSLSYEYVWGVGALCLVVLHGTRYEQERKISVPVL